MSPTISVASSQPYRTALALSAGPIVSAGLGRFAYGLLLPSMRTDLGWSYEQAGWIGTANSAGYLIGCLVCLRFGSRIGAVALFNGGMILCALTLILTGWLAAFPHLAALRLLNGVFAAAPFIAGGVIAGRLVPVGDPRSATAIGIYYGGAGIGILISGFGIPLWIDWNGTAEWRTIWIVMGSTSLMLAWISGFAARSVTVPLTRARPGLAVVRGLRAALLSYFLFATGYIAYMTFLVAWMRNHGASTGEIAFTWSLLGGATLMSAWAWRGALTHWPLRWPLVASNAALGTGALIPLVSNHPFATALSALVFGLALFTPPAAALVIVKRLRPPESWNDAVATFTTLFAVGQLFGPVLTGYIADRTGSLRPGLAGSAAILILAAAVALAQDDRAP